ncbi:MAG TPA: isochorismatase family cysteine hydrolase [Actinomycetota bacterium]|nr:isochorismatase family cysteine hydrolase [Actinomycetota bacterium]
MSRTGLLIIDMQNDMCHPEGRMFIRDAAHRAETMARVLQAFRETRQPVIHAVRSYRADSWDVERFRVPYFQNDRGFFIEGTWGRQIIDRLTPEPGEPIIVKQRFSAFMQTELDLLLRRADIDRIAVMGQNLPNCPRATMVDAVALDYDVIAVEDGLATGTEDTRIANLRDLEGIGIRIATANEVILEIHRAADRAASNEERR